MATELTTAFKGVMSRFATGVTVVTTLRELKPAGITVSSFASLSLEPPLVLVCLDEKRKLLSDVKVFGAFAVNILPIRMQREGQIFAGLVSGEKDRFDRVFWRPSLTGCPIFVDAMAWVDCKLFDIYPGGDHSIVIGEVVDADITTNDDEPLLYYKRKWLPAETEGQPKPETASLTKV